MEESVEEKPTSPKQRESSSCFLVGEKRPRPQDRIVICTQAQEAISHRKVVESHAPNKTHKDHGSGPAGPLDNGC